MVKSIALTMCVKKLLNSLSKDQQSYYTFLAKECLSGFSNAENNFNIYRYASCYAWLFHSSEFFWKALTILSGNYFEPKHEASQADMTKISKEILSNDERIRAYDIISKFPNIRRDLARYGYYQKGTYQISY
jgi:HEPN domain-containing protein